MWNIQRCLNNSKAVPALEPASATATAASVEAVDVPGARNLKVAFGFLKCRFLKFVFVICLWNSFLKFCFEMCFWKLCFWILFLEYVFDIRHSHFRSRSAFHFVDVILKLEERMEGSQKHRKLAWSTMPPNKKAWHLCGGRRLRALCAHFGALRCVGIFRSRRSRELRQSSKPRFGSNEAEVAEAMKGWSAEVGC